MKDSSLLLIFFPRRVGLRKATCFIARDRICSVDPAAKVHELAAVRAERKGRQIEEFRDRIRLTTDRAKPLDHSDDPFDEDVGFADSLFAGVDEDEDEEVEDVVEEDEAESAGFDSLGLSAAALFLYESLR